MPVTLPATTTDPELEAAFRATRYRVETDEGVCDVRIGRRHRQLDRIAGPNPWCILTACNPAARRVAERLNRRADRALHRQLQRLEPHVLLRAVNHDPTGRWPDEPAWFFTFAHEAGVDDLAARFGQAAVVIGEPGRAARLKFYDDAAACGRNHSPE